jgi:hypothetical protein
LGEIAQELGAGRRVLVGIPIHVSFEGELVKTIGRVAGGAATARGWRLADHRAMIVQGKALRKCLREKIMFEEAGALWQARFVL